LSATAPESDRLLRCTRTVRRGLDLERPVARELLLECLASAVQAPSGSNRQAWHFIFVSEPERKLELARLYRSGFQRYEAQLGPTEGDPAAVRLLASARYLAANLERAPWLLVPVQRGRLQADATTQTQAAFWGSILPALWSFMLAARARSLGTAWTTMHLAHEEEAAEILGLPPGRYTQAGLTPIAHLLRPDVGPGPRRPTADVVSFERFSDRAGA